MFKRLCFKDETRTRTGDYGHISKACSLSKGGVVLDYEPTIAQRRRFGLFLVTAYRELRSVYPGGFETFLVATCASIGNRRTGRPVNVSSIAKLTGIPRPTVIRKLHLLEDMGLVRRAETAKGTMVYMSPDSWEHVRTHVANLLELESEMIATDRH